MAGQFEIRLIGAAFMDTFLAWIESSALSEWVRGSECICAFPGIITVHTICMGLLAGGSTAIDLRILGFAPGIPIERTAGLLPLLWVAFAVNAITGTILLIAYPTKQLTNPVFYVKVAMIAAAVWLFYRVGRVITHFPAGQKAATAEARLLAIASITAWVALIVAGRLLQYTHKWEMLGVPSVI
jgi:hypothetical protein